MAYIGNTPVPQATQTRDRFVATSGQTSFATSGYTPGFVDVYLDGVKLDQDEYTATNGSDVVLDSGATTGQILEVVAFSSFDVADIRNMTQPLGLKGYTTTQRNALTNIGAGDTIYNSTTGSIEFYDGANWIATNLIPTVNSVTGTIYAGASSTLTLNITNATESVTVRFSEGGSVVSDVADVTVTSGSASVTVPASVYGQTTGDTISVSILNQDGTPSSNAISKTVVGLPTGGTITSSGGYRYHKFTSSGTFTVPAGFSATAAALIVAGGGGANGHLAGGGGGGGVLEQSPISVTTQTYSVVVGAGGSPASDISYSATNGSNSSVFGFSAIGGGASGASSTNGSSGGSGGGGGGSNGGSASSGGAGTTGQGNAGGGGSVADKASEAGGGGGKGGPGGSATSTAAGNGGIGGDYSVWATATSSGESGYYAGGGGGGVDGRNGGTTGTGGLGGGGNGIKDITGLAAESGAVNTGGGGGGGSGGDGGVRTTGGSGGSGIVLIRYQLS
jgi:hypothetical protein